MRRVALLAVALLVVLAGCSAAGSISLEPAAEDEELAEKASRTVPPSDHQPQHRTVLGAIENGSATTTGLEPVLGPGLPYAHDGAYYNVTWSVVERERGVVAHVGVDLNGSAPAEETVDFEDLSPTDRKVLGEPFPPDHASAHTEGVDMGVTGRYNESERERSVLLSGEYSAVRSDGEVYPVTVQNTRSVTIRTYEYEATQVAADDAAYAEHLRSTYLFELSGLSDAEREVVEGALNDTYYAEDTSDDAFESVLDRFHEHRAIQQGDVHGTWLVRYDGEVYVAELSYQGFADD